MYKEVEKMTNSKKMNPQKLKDTLLKYALYIILLLLLVVIVAIKLTKHVQALDLSMRFR